MKYLLNIHKPNGTTLVFDKKWNLNNRKPQTSLKVHFNCLCMIFSMSYLSFPFSLQNPLLAEFFKKELNWLKKKSICLCMSSREWLKRELAVWVTKISWITCKIDGWLRAHFVWFSSDTSELKLELTYAIAEWQKKQNSGLNTPKFFIKNYAKWHGEKLYGKPNLEGTILTPICTLRHCKFNLRDPESLNFNLPRAAAKAED